MADLEEDLNFEGEVEVKARERERKEGEEKHLRGSLARRREKGK